MYELRKVDSKLATSTIIEFQSIKFCAEYLYIHTTHLLNSCYVTVVVCLLRSKIF